MPILSRTVRHSRRTARHACPRSPAENNARVSRGPHLSNAAPCSSAHSCIGVVRTWIKQCSAAHARERSEGCNGV